MAPNLLFYQLLVVALVLMCFIIHVGWPDEPPRAPQAPLEPNKRRRKGSKDPKPFPGLIHTPLCETCAQGPIPAPRQQGRHLLSSPSPEGADAPSTPLSTAVRITIAPITAGSDVATSVLMGTPAASLGANFHVSRAMDISLRRLAPSFMGSAPRWS